MKLVSWNVNGLRACLGKGFLDFCAFADADVICLQETKMRPEQAEFDLPGYERYWNSADKAGYSGTAVFTRQTPLSVTYDFGKEVHRHEGRVITAEYPEFYLVCCYTPNSKDQLSRLDYRMEWEDDLRDYLHELDAKKPVVYCGDLNVAHEEIDIKNPKSNRMNPGFSDEERAKMTQLLESGFTDTFRYLYPIRPGHIRGGAIGSTPGKTTPDGASTTSSCLTGCVSVLKAPTSGARSRAATTARWCWSWIFKTIHLS